MRIISGNLKGKKIFFPKDKKTRPLRDLVKESIFNLIEHSKKIKISIKEANILDLFSGSGSFGLECISRGANSVVFIENYIEALNILKKNISNLKANEKSKIINIDCFNFFKKNENSSKQYDLIFLDPPYKEKRTYNIIETIKKKNFLKKNGIIILHKHKSDNLEITKKIEVLDIRSYGISKIIIGS